MRPNGEHAEFATRFEAGQCSCTCQRVVHCYQLVRGGQGTSCHANGRRKTRLTSKMVWLRLPCIAQVEIGVDVNGTLWRSLDGCLAEAERGSASVDDHDVHVYVRSGRDEAAAKRRLRSWTRGWIWDRVALSPQDRVMLTPTGAGGGGDDSGGDFGLIPIGRLVSRPLDSIADELAELGLSTGDDQERPAVLGQSAGLDLIVARPVLLDPAFIIAGVWTCMPIECRKLCVQCGVASGGSGCIGAGRAVGVNASAGTVNRSTPRPPPFLPPPPPAPCLQVALPHQNPLGASATLNQLPPGCRR